MQTIKKQLFLIVLSSLPLLLQSQSGLVNQGHLVSEGGFLVLHNSKWTNNGTVTLTKGTVKVMGTVMDSGSSIGGSTESTFNNLEINKTMNNVVLTQSAQVNGQLILSGGLVDLGNFDFTLGEVSTVTGQTSSRYVKTSGSGELRRTVGSSEQVFPIGKSSYNPVKVTNTGVSDVLGFRVTDEVQGTDVNVVNGQPLQAATTAAVNRTWQLSEGTPGGSNLSVNVEWNGSEELPGFGRNQSSLATRGSGAWTQKNSGAASGSGPYAFTGTGITAGGSLAIANALCQMSGVTLLGDQESQGGTISGSGTVCIASNLSLLTLSGERGAIQWQSATDLNFTSPVNISNTTNVHAPQNLMETTYFRAVVQNGVCPQVFSTIASVVVDNTDSDNNGVADCVDLANCENMREVEDVFGTPIISGTYRAIFTITSDGTVNTDTSVTFKAGQSITLKPNFHAKGGSIFLAKIEACVITETIIEDGTIVAQQEISLPSPIEGEPLQLKVFPNPFKETAQIYFRLPQEDIVTVGVYDQTGRLIEEVLQEQRYESGDYYIRLSGSSYQGGMHYVMLQSSRERLVQKVVVLREGGWSKL